MYSLTFKKNKSKYFPAALAFAKELHCEFTGDDIIINVAEEQLLESYGIIRQLFALIQNWKSTGATYKGAKVHPYQFIFHTHQIALCQSRSLQNAKNCLTLYSNPAWSCRKLDVIKYEIGGLGNYKQNNKFWYNFGYFQGDKWIINKEVILEKLLSYASKKGIDICGLFDVNKIRFAVDNLPDSITPNGIDFEIHYIEQYLQGVKVQIPDNIRHIT